MVFAAPVLVVYVAVGWNQKGPLFAPIRALSTTGSDEDASSLARLEEDRNLVYTLWVAGNPVLGTGWGQPYQKVTSVYANFGDEWWQYAYMPHNSLLGVAVFAGVGGNCARWLGVRPSWGGTAGACGRLARSQEPGWGRGARGSPAWWRRSVRRSAIAGPTAPDCGSRPATRSSSVIGASPSWT